MNVWAPRRGTSVSTCRAPISQIKSSKYLFFECEIEKKLTGLEECHENLALNRIPASISK